VDLIQLTQDMTRLKALVFTAMDFGVPQKAENFDHQHLEIVLSWKQTYIAA
jgi:hypothetical protein